MATAYFTTPKSNDRLAQLWADLRADPVPPQPVATQPRSVRATVLLRQDEAVRRTWKVDFATLFHSLLEPDAGEPRVPSAAEAIPERSLEAAHEASLAISSPFHWEPKPAWINSPGHVTPAFLNPTDPRRFVPKPKIPLRPLHKQPFYRRFFFYLSHWLSRPR